MRIRLIGGFEVIGSDGTDLSPRGAKARAILAMLCQTPDRRRPRRWLEGRLWSDRAPEQASGSLRQSLSELRRALGPHARQLSSERDHIRLDGVETDIEADPAGAARDLAAGREFLEGIDIADRAFLDWLRDERLRVSDRLQRHPRGRPAPAPGNEGEEAVPLVVETVGLPEGVGRFAGLALADGVARLAGEFAHFDLFGLGGAPLPQARAPGGLILSIGGAEIGDRLHLLVGLRSAEAGQTVWSQRAQIPADEADPLAGPGLAPLVFQAAEAALAHLAQLPSAQAGPRQVNALIARALVEMFSYDAARLARADAMLAEALEFGPSARVQAWRSLVRQIMVVERVHPDPARLRDEADACARAALELGEGNPLVLALVSQVRVMLDENPEAGTVLARGAVELSPFNAYGQAALTGAYLRAGRMEAALAAAQAGAQLAARSANVHWWESLAGLSALAAGRHEAAIAHYEAAHYRAPNFRSPMRHLLFLYLAAGRRAKAERVLADLVRAEPDFTLDRIRSDPDYPAATLRRSGLLHGPWDWVA
jgi:DNA-binding SARP family transcriptional activator